MKYIKYLVLALIVSFVASSCSQDKPEFNWKDADYSKAFVQVYYMSLVTNSSANNIKYITINGTEYSYDHQSMITPYNFSPAYVVGSSYSTEPGVCTVKLETESSVKLKDENGNVIRTWDNTADSTEYVRKTVYQGATEVSLKPGVISQVIVWDDRVYNAEKEAEMDAATQSFANGKISFEDYTNVMESAVKSEGAAPHVHEFGVPPIYHEVDSTGNARFASARLYNYMFDANGKPTEARLFFDVRRKSNGEIYATYPDDGIGLAFGESTDYFTTILWEDQILAQSGYIYVRQDIRAVWPVGSELYPEGKEEILLKNDYWTTYMGRSYHYFYHGAYNKDVFNKKLTRFTAK